MNSLTLYSEPYSPTGNIASAGVLNQLGRPKLDVLAVLVREAVQNSWDARQTSSEPIRFGIGGWILSQPQREVLRKEVFRQCPSGLELRTLLDSDKEVQALAIYDRGTEGLGGPTRADDPTLKDESNNFVDFLRNIGQPPDRNFTGGTYGYGKTIFYKASLLHTIIVHTHCQFRGRRESRFMAAALGTAYSNASQRFTGRHWWGSIEEGVVEPVLNNQAELLAEALGLPNFQTNALGTTIVILQPNFEDRNPLEAMKLMAEYLLWYFWPKMLNNSSGKPFISFEIIWQGEIIAIPAPNEFPPLEGFVQAMNRLKNAEVQPIAGLGEIYNIDSKLYRQPLGKLALERFPVRQRPNRITSPIQGLSHHVALMRQPELVVRYLEGPELPTAQIEYAGVFITDPQVDAVFAEAEPPTHDDWISNILSERREKTYINTALREIKNKLNEFVRPPSTGTVPGEVTPLGAFANQLGELLPGQMGPVANVNPFARHPPVKSVPTFNSVSTISENGVTNNVHNNNSTNGDETPVQSKTIPTKSGASETSKAENVTPFNSKNSSNALSVLGQNDVISSDISQKVKTSKQSKRVRISQIGQAELIVLEDAQLTALQVEFELIVWGNPEALIIRVTVGAVLDGDEIESEPPKGDEAPTVLYWVDPSGHKYEGSAELTISPDQVGVWHVVVSSPEAVMVGMELSALIC